MCSFCLVVPSLHYLTSTEFNIQRISLYTILPKSCGDLMPFIFLWFTNCFHGCFFKRDFSDVVVMKTLRCNFLDVLRRTYCNIVGGFVEFQPLLRDELLFPIFSSSKVTLLMKAVGWIVVSSINTSRETIPLHNIGSTMFDAFLLHFFWWDFVANFVLLRKIYWINDLTLQDCLQSELFLVQLQALISAPDLPTKRADMFLC